MRSVLTVACLLWGTWAGAAEPEQADLPRQAQAILKKHCHRCHGQDGVAEGGFNYVLDFPKLVTRKKVVAASPERSRLFQRLVSVDDPMPPQEEKTRPSSDEVARVKRWIEAGAGAFQPAKARPFITPTRTLELIRADLESIGERSRPFTRYFTLTHLFNAGLSVEELRSYHHGLSKLVNSLSWGREIVPPRLIDPEQTVLRIDLRDYQWNEKVWATIEGHNPYGVCLPTEAARHAARATRCRQPYVRGDWFVAAASRPPLYHDVLQLPPTEQELEKLLRIDVAENIRQERVARAGFNGSGVSRNNRLIERHESGRVVYWKSYDFAGNTNRQNLFAHPLGPGDKDNGFQHDGGEIIFNLPNGLQGYFLADARGRRLDKGPTAIVSDPRRPDRAVENGLSCMSCHARGLIDKGDQIRAHVLKNEQAFARDERETILALYPPGEKVAALLREDARRFQEAVARTGAPWSTTEPVAALALRFEAELDLSLAAAEAGVPSAEFLRAVARSATLAKQLGPLQVEGGTVQRAVFVACFAELVRTLELGQYLTPDLSPLVQCLVRGERLLRQGDAAGARQAFTEALALEPKSARAFLGRGDAQCDRGDVARALDDYHQAVLLEPGWAVAYNNRGLALSRAGELDRAIADFSEALRLDPAFAIAFHNRGAACYRQGNLERALADYSAALRLEPNSAVVCNNRGFAYLDKGDFGRALADFNEALRLDPRFAIAFNNRGLLHSRSGAPERAIADFSEAIRLDPRFARAYFNRGIAFEKKGDADRARLDRAEALRLDPALDKIGSGP